MTISARKRPSPQSLDPVSRNLLPILRHFLTGLQEPASTGWQNAYGIAAEVWGEGRGLAVAFRAQKFLAALLRSRSVPLRHADPLCPEDRLTLTDDECLLLALLSHMRDDETAQARDMLAALTCGRVEAAVVRTGLELCGILDGGAAASSRGAPRLTVVQ